MTTPAPVQQEPLLEKLIPPLRGGERLTRPEFERRFDATPGLKKAELLEGIVYMPPPVSDGYHGGPHFDLIGWLCMYRAFTPGVAGGDNSSLRVDLFNMPQPDAYLRILHSLGGRCDTDEEGYIVGVPELVAEVSASSADTDLGTKLELYRRNGVREYIVWRTYDRAIDWFVLRAGRFEPLPPDAAGLYRSEVFPGLWLDPAALVRGDMLRVGQVVQQGLASPEHAEFVARLRAGSSPP